MLRIELPIGYCIRETPVCWEVINPRGEVFAEVGSFESAYQHFLSKMPESRKVRNRAEIFLEIK